ncbi:MAG: hypothetical protein JWO82_2677 [Akkermansiaceae bacterium]|nr:hypothetical protein [Akkermansiaceae bacterium]
MRIMPAISMAERTTGLVMGNGVVVGMIYLISRNFDGFRHWIMIAPLVVGVMSWWHCLGQDSNAVLKRVLPVFRGHVAKWGGNVKVSRRLLARRGYLFLTDREIIFCRRPLTESAEEWVIPLDQLIGVGHFAIGDVTLSDRSGRVRTFSSRSPRRWLEVLRGAMEARGFPAPDFQQIHSGPRWLGLPFFAIGLAVNLRVGHLDLLLTIGGIYLAGIVVWRWSIRNSEARVRGRLPEVPGHRILCGGPANGGELFITDETLVYFPRGAERSAPPSLIPLEKIRVVTGSSGRLTIQLQDGRGLSFRVGQAKAWVEWLRAALK